MRTISFIILILLSSSLLNGQSRGRWCEGAISYDTALSPKGKYKIIVKDTELIVVNMTTGNHLKRKIDILPPSELAWSPNDSLFFINQSDGGAIGTWAVQVYKIADDNIVETNLAKKPLEEFQKKMEEWCPDEFPNIAACGWVDNGTKILIVGAVPNHSSCKGMGNIFCYLIDIRSAEIIDSFNKKLLNQKWPEIIGAWVQE